MSPIKRMTSAFSSAGDRSSRFPGGDMPLQNLKSLYAESPDLPIFTQSVSPCPLQLPPAKPPPPGLLPLLRYHYLTYCNVKDLQDARPVASRTIPAAVICRISPIPDLHSVPVRPCQGSGP